MRPTVLLLLTGSLVIADLASAQTCGCDISTRFVAAYNELLELSDAEKADAEARHMPWGVPETVTANERLLHQDGYVINHDGDLRTATWVAYRLTAEDLSSDRERTECFRPDPRLPDEAAGICNDYEEPTYDRGHLVPNADMERSEAAMITTYMFSNMAPQHAGFNRGIWQRLERYVRKWARLKGEIHVITGAVFDQNADSLRDNDSDAKMMKPKEGVARVAIPTHFYKIILHERSDTFIENMAFVLPHDEAPPTGDKANQFLTDQLTSIDVIERMTGVDFLSDLPSNKELAVEAHVASKMWPR
ncbi:MAG: DNA/RNA non-specific endonuclease [Bacteroidetes bacterium]|nr:DNA/RNA non-specific endonuclease [Bacteroidota bacterium]